SPDWFAVGADGGRRLRADTPETNRSFRRHSRTGGIASFERPSATRGRFETHSGTDCVTHFLVLLSGSNGLHRSNGDRCHRGEHPAATSIAASKPHWMVEHVW